jgi:hypothetical protein
MRFRGFREFVSGKVDYFVKNDLSSCMKDLFVGLKRLSFEDNFESFQVTLKFEAGVSDVILDNQLSGVPSKWIVVRVTSGYVVLSDGPIWNAEKLSLRNSGASSGTATVLFMR